MCVPHVLQPDPTFELCSDALRLTSACRNTGGGSAWSPLALLRCFHFACLLLARVAACNTKRHRLYVMQKHQALSPYADSRQLVPNPAPLLEMKLLHVSLGWYVPGPGTLSAELGELLLLPKV